MPLWWSSRSSRIPTIRLLHLPLFVVTVLLTCALQPGGIFAQDELQSAALDSITAGTDSTAMVVLADNELFVVGSQSVVSAEERAAALSEAILELAKSRRMGSDDLNWRPSVSRS